jgi:T-complex protein 1 subunit alpha
LVEKGNDLIRQGVHPTTVISGYLLAKKEACQYVATHMTSKVEELGKDALINVARTSISSKILHGDSEFFGKLAVDAVSAVKTESKKGRPKYPIKNINVLKAHGKSARDSELVNGYAVNATRASQAMPTRINKAKIAIVDIDFRKSKMPHGITVAPTDPTKLDKIRAKEAEITKRRIQLLLDAGVNVVFTSQGIDDLALKMFVEAGALAARRLKKSDLEQIAKATGGQVLISLADFKQEESIDQKSIGLADVVEEVKVGDGEMLYIRGCKSSRAQTIVLRGANDIMLDEMDRSLHDAMSVVKRVLESKTVVPGGGAVEAALSVFLEHVADTMGSRQQLPVTAFGSALLVIPKVLAANAALDATDLVAKLRAYHDAAQTKKKEQFKWTGLDLEEGKVRNNLKAGVLEPALAKIKMIKFATEAAVTILRIDDAIKMNPRKPPKHPHEESSDEE